MPWASVLQGSFRPRTPARCLGLPSALPASPARVPAQLGLSSLPWAGHRSGSNPRRSNPGTPSPLLLPHPTWCYSWGPGGPGAPRELLSEDKVREGPQPLCHLPTTVSPSSIPVRSMPIYCVLGVSDLQPAGPMQPRTAVNVAQHKVVNLLKTL